MRLVLWEALITKQGARTLSLRGVGGGVPGARKWTWGCWSEGCCGWSRAVTEAEERTGFERQKGESSALGEGWAMRREGEFGLHIRQGTQRTLLHKCHGGDEGKDNGRRNSKCYEIGVG